MGKETLELNEKLAPFVSHSACASSFSPSSIHQHENDSKGNLDISQHSTKTVDSSTNIECSVKLNRVLSKKDLLSMAPLERRLSLVDLDYQSSSLMQGERGYNDNGSYRPEDGSGESNTESSLSLEADEDSRRVDAEFGDHHHNYKIDYCDEDNYYYQKKISKSLRSSPPLGQSADDVTIINDTFTYLNASTSYVSSNSLNDYTKTIDNHQYQYGNGTGNETDHYRDGEEKSINININSMSTPTFPGILT